MQEWLFWSLPDVTDFLYLRMITESVNDQDRLGEDETRPNKCAYGEVRTFNR